MTRPTVNRVVLLLLGLLLLAAGLAGAWSGSGLSVDALPPLRSPGELWAPIGRLVEAYSELWPLVALVAGLLAVLLGLALLEGQLRAGRRRRRRRADFDVSPGGRDAALVRGSALSSAVATDLTRILEVESASVVTWEDDQSTRLQAVVGLLEGTRIENVHGGIQGVLGRAERALDGRQLDASIRVDLLDRPAPRVR